MYLAAIPSYSTDKPKEEDKEIEIDGLEEWAKLLE